MGTEVFGVDVACGLVDAVEGARVSRNKSSGTRMTNSTIPPSIASKAGEVFAGGGG